MPGELAGHSLMRVTFSFLLLAVISAASEKKEPFPTSLLRRDSAGLNLGSQDQSTGDQQMIVTSAGRSVRAKEPPQRFQSKESGKQHIFVLTEPGSKKQTEKFLKAVTDWGYVGDDAVAPISGVALQGFSSQDSKGKSGLSQDQKIEEKQKLMKNMLDKEATSTNAPAFPPGFISSALLTQSPEQLAKYLSHRRFWEAAAKLPSNSWAVIFEDDVELLGGPEILRGLLMQADEASGDMAGIPASIVYLRGCEPGGNFIKSFLRDSSGYAIRAQTAKDLLAHAHGDLAVGDAIKTFTEGGLCAPIIKSKGHPTIQERRDDYTVKTFVLTFPRNRNQFNKFTWKAAAFGYFGDYGISTISGTDYKQYYPSESSLESTGGSQKDISGKKQAFQQQAKHKMLEAFAKSTSADNFTLPQSFVDDAEKSLSPRQLATYLGHIAFWREAAKLPSDSWAVLFEDNAKLVTGPRHIEGFLHQAELVASKVIGGPAELVYMKQCAHGNKFMSTFFPDARGYAIRPKLAQSLLRNASGHDPVPVAIKHYTEGGLCAPVLQVEDQPRKVPIMEEPLRMFVLTVPRNQVRLSAWLKNSSTLGFSGNYSINQLKGIDYTKFVTNESDSKENSTGPKGAGKPTREAVHKMFMEFVGDKESDAAHSKMPEDFVYDAAHNLNMKEMAIYLGHRRFWIEASKLPEDAWAVLLQDDAQLLGGPVLLRNLLLQAELAGKRLTGHPAELVYLKKCESGDGFMPSFMKDSQGYAIRASTAKDLLESAPGRFPVAEAIKRFSGGGMCAPLVRTAGATKPKKVHKLGWSSDEAEDPEKDEKDDDRLEAEPPNSDVMSTHIHEHRAERYKPHQLQIDEAGLADSAGNAHVFVLTIPRNKKRMSHFIESSAKMGYNESNSIEQIDGTDYQEFYPTDSEMKSLSLTENQKVARRQKAAQDMFEAMAGRSVSASTWSTEFMSGALKHLGPLEVATYLGHREFWKKAAALPSKDWAVFLEDDADLVAGPSVMKSFLQEADAASAKLHGDPAELVYLKPCPTGRSFGEYFLRDAMGYAIRPKTAQDLLDHASGDLPVPLAIKQFTKGGLCVPLIKDAETTHF
eukprot:gnl/MRDRNA2_/MRDRNA2_97901_c0_seq1.p1 gnl/MRDRNA2_/MRDRNA2_97901_c0~~gnl/MRDRNA2_/MRDRNA2_97901_c0_seq1.p1  ORF type:complete len:1092 (-),score=247.47 gnl/MRDRNA2_/MRDRNA2_97901_c0_seq1:10-3285(-)